MSRTTNEFGLKDYEKRGPSNGDAVRSAVGRLAIDLIHDKKPLISQGTT
jgi:hypothetical protein